MIQHMTRLVCADNSGAKIVQCIGVLGQNRGGNYRIAKVGSVITVTVKAARPIINEAGVRGMQGGNKFGQISMSDDVQSSGGSGSSGGTGHVVPGGNALSGMNPLTNRVSQNVGGVRKGEIYQALVVRTRKEFQRPDGRTLKYSQNNNNNKLLYTIAYCGTFVHSLWAVVFFDRFDDNAAVLLTRPGKDSKEKYGKPIGTRVYGPVPVELRRLGWLKLLSLSSKVIL